MLTAYDHSVRKRRITGTRIGGIVGAHKYLDRLMVWIQIQGLDARNDDEESVDSKRGTYLEPSIARWYADETGREVEAPLPAIVCANDDRFAATPDGLSWGKGKSDKRALEIKCPRFGDDWGEAGTDAIPDYYQCQVAWEMMVADVEALDVAAFFNGELHVYHMRRNRELEGYLVREADAFWLKYIETGMPPPAGAHSSAWLAQRFKSHAPRYLEATEEVDAIARRLAAARAAQKAAELERAECENQLKQLLGDHEGVRGEGYRCTWKMRRGRRFVDWHRYALELGGSEDDAKRLYMGANDDGRTFLFKEVAG